MSFYRDYRPSRFQDIIGQGEAIQAVKRSIVAGRQQGQEVKVTIDKNGVINYVEVTP
jgi:hypothetical protein